MTLIRTALLQEIAEYFSKHCHTEEAQALEFQINELLTRAPKPEVWIVSEEEPDNEEFPSVVVEIYDNEEAARQHVLAEREERGLADDDDYEEADISWLVEKHEVQSTPVKTIETRATELRTGEN